MALILVVDDDTQVRSMLRMTLEQAGYEVEEAGDGNEASRIQRARPADLAIVDILMPERDGLETIMEYRKHVPRCRIIAISGGGRQVPGDFLQEARLLGADRTFCKPVDRRELLDSIRVLLGDRSQ